ncbi:MAG TPA: DUF4147 domain-containing protein [Vicinamibacterales bacterium]
MLFRAAVEAVSTPRLLEVALALPEIQSVLDAGSVRVLSAGKASAHMAVAYASAGAPAVAGVVVGTHASSALPAPFEWIPGSHPVPDARSVAAGARSLELARGVPANGALVVLLSGGASSLLALPRAGITLADKQSTTRRLLLAGADIDALNTVRKHLSAIKGGQLAAAVAGRTVALAVSDVVTNDTSVIGSGPTVPDPTTFADAWRMLERLGGVGSYPAAVVDLLRRGTAGEEPETPKPGDPRLDRVLTRVIGTRMDAVAGARRAAEALGYATIVLDEPVVGEAREAGPALVAMVRHRTRDVRGPACVIAAGETTVHVTGRGRGGRNQELVLSAARAIAALGGPAAMLSGGTDGIDGPTDAAGGIADGTTLVRTEQAGLGTPEAFLADNNAYPLLHALGDLVVIGPTDTNVGDVQIVLLQCAPV